MTAAVLPIKMNAAFAADPVWFLPSVLIAATAVSAGLVGLLVRLAPRIGLLDRPNERSSHTRVTPRGGGVGIVGAVMLVGGAMLGLGVMDPARWWSLILGAASGIALISLWDDFRSLHAGIRFACHAAAACAAVIGIARHGAAGPLFDSGPGLCSYVVPVGLVLWSVGLTNVYNFMDGIDGIAGLQGVVAGCAWCLAGAYLGQSSVSAMGALVAGSCAGFLAYNWSPAKIFMGDVGSAFLGFVFAVLPLIAAGGLSDDATVEGWRVLVFAILVVWPFIADGAFTFCRRLLKGEQVWKAHRSHLYQRMVQAGLSHAKVATLYCVWSVTCSVSGLCNLQDGKWLWPATAAISFATTAWVFTFYLERRKARCGGGADRQG